MVIFVVGPAGEIMGSGFWDGFTASARSLTGVGGEVFLMVKVVVLFVVVTVNTSACAVVRSLVRGRGRAFGPRIRGVLGRTMVGGVTRGAGNLTLGKLDGSPGGVKACRAQAFYSGSALFACRRGVRSVSARVLFAHRLKLLVVSDLRDYSVRTLVVGSLGGGSVGKCVGAKVVISGRLRERV